MEGEFGDVRDLLDTFVRLSSRDMLQMGMEREVEEFLGRPYYQRGGRRREGWRNGYEPKRLRTPQGKLPLLVPQVRDTRDPFQSRFLKAMGNSSQALQDMVLKMYVRGLSSR